MPGADQRPLRLYWDQWADDVVDISANQTARINAILTTDDPAITEQFDAFLEGLQANLNDSIDRDAAVNMLSQHLITKPVFDALFEHDSFAAHNPVSITMQTMVDALAGHGLDAETASLEKFYDSVRNRAASINTPGGRQTVIQDLYEDYLAKRATQRGDRHRSKRLHQVRPPHHTPNTGNHSNPVHIISPRRSSGEMRRRPLGDAIHDNETGVTPMLDEWIPGPRAASA